MPSLEPRRSFGSIRFKDVYGVFIRTPDDVEFRTGSISGAACVVSDPERRGLLGPIVERLLTLDAAERRPWNDAEAELLEEFVPELRASGIIETDGPPEAPDAGRRFPAPMLGKAMAEARIAVVGHGVLGQAVRALLTGMPCGSITVIESASVAEAGEAAGLRGFRPEPPSAAAVPERSLPRPRSDAQWAEAVGGHDWVVAAQDCFEPEELTALNKAALQRSMPWSLVCFDGYEGWVGPTFVPRQTACFDCFQRRLFAGAAEPKHVFMDPRVRVHRVPSPWSAGPETVAWVSLITSMFALELIAATQGRGFTLNNFLVVHRLNLTFQRELVLRMPRCPACSDRGDGPSTNVFSQVLSTRPMRK